MYYLLLPVQVLFGNLSSICSGVSILRFEWSETLWLETLATQDKSEGLEAKIHGRH